MKTPFFLTDVANDWPDSNLIVLQEAILTANQAVLERTNEYEDPLLASPNLPNIRGFFRWAILNKILDQAAQSGQLQGITSRWVDLGGVSVLELIGAHTRVTPCHLVARDETPRESVYRKSGRIENEVYQTLFPMGEDQDQLINLLLVHGGKHETFAFLRSYSDPQDRSAYIEISENIMLMPALLESLDFEPIEDPQIELNPDASEGAGEETGAAGQ